MKSLFFSTESLIKTLKSLSVSGPYYVAYSGGLDSHVLLHALQSLRTELDSDIHALHVNHGINSQSEEWARRCEQNCRALDVNFTLLKIEGCCPQGESREAWAREWRYQLLANKMANNGLLLSAHHQDDQAETLLLQMIRGAGVKGLASMPVLKRRNGIWHARPLLQVSRQQLLDYAKIHKLEWIEDDSNSDQLIDRNYFRHQIIPALQRRWPGINKTLSRVASHQAEAVQLLDDLGEMDWRECRVHMSACLNIDKVLRLSSARQANLIRYWLRAMKLTIPASGVMDEILNKLLRAENFAESRVSWTGTELRRYRDQLYADRPLPAVQKNLVIEWHILSTCQLSGGVLSAKLGKGKGIKVDICPDNYLQIRYRQGGEKIQLKNKKHRQELKKLFQQRGIPPWIRDRTPLLFKNEKLIAVADLWTDAEACSETDEPAWQLCWTGTTNSLNPLPAE